MARCLNKDADSRPSAAELLKEPIFKHAHDSKWLAKRLLAASAAKAKAGGRRLKFQDGKEGMSPTSMSPSQTVAPVSLLPPRRQCWGVACSVILIMPWICPVTMPNHAP